jgi:hypothetical protein
MAWKDVQKSEDLLKRFRTYSKELRKSDGEAFAHLMGMVSEADPSTARQLYAEIAAEEESQQEIASHAAQEDAQQTDAVHAAQEDAQQETAAYAASEDAQQADAVHAAQEDAQQETAAHAAQEEMQQMRTAILDKIPVLVQSGMREEALATVRALRQMFPGDEEIDVLLAQL